MRVVSGGDVAMTKNSFQPIHAGIQRLVLLDGSSSKSLALSLARVQIEGELCNSHLCDGLLVNQNDRHARFVAQQQQMPP